MKKQMLSAALVALLAAPAFAQNIAVVNGKPVPTARLNALKAQIERSGRPVTDEMLGQLKEEVVAREIFMQEARKRGLDASDEYKNQLELARQTILIRELFADFQKKNPVTDAEIQGEYDKFVAANGGKEYRARHILVETEDQAKALIAEIQKGGKFEELAKKHSKDPGSAQRGGDLDYARPESYVPEFGQAMAKLKKGETSEPVRSQFGWHIIRLEDTREAQFPPLEEVRDRIAQQMVQNKLQAYQQGLRDKAKNDFKFSQ